MELNFARLGSAVAKTREVHGWSQDDLARTINMSRSAVQNLERGRPFRREPDTLALVEKAFNWAPGSCMDVLRGGEPTIAPEPPTPGRDDGTAPAIVAELDDKDGELLLVQLVQGASELTVPQRRKLLAQVRALQAELLSDGPSDVQ